MGRLWNPGAFAGEPLAHLAPRIGDRFGTFKYARIGHQPQEGEQARPRQADIGKSAELPVEPFPRRAMLTERAHMGVDQNIGIEQDHLKDSPSATASASLTLSRGPVCTRPSATARVRNGSRGVARGLIALM